MWLDPILVTPPAAEPILLADAKLAARAGDNEDSLITALISVARDHVERYTGLRLLTQTLKLSASRFEDLDHLPIAPIQSVTSVQYLDGNGALQTLDPTLYEVFGGGFTWGIRPAYAQRWPTTRRVADAVKVTTVAGYDSAGAVPAAIVQAMQLLIGDYYSSREDTIAERGVVPATLPNGVDALLANFRVG